MQSGSNSILKAMRRPYTIEKFSAIIAKIRALQPDIHISTDIIVGFPGESDADFEATRTAFDALRFDMAYLFKYSVRPDTTAEPLGDPVTTAVKESRNQILLDILSKHSLARNESLVGTVQEVLFEGPAKRGESMFVGRTRGYRKVIVKASPRLVGQLASVRIERATISSLFGELVLEGLNG
jgi:tRNA-2-methylthio-N6-dimethylallyladenosine synthase